MSQFIGTRLGPYEILSAIGAGGMGEVYRAHDTKLNRDVALKLLPVDVASDPERLARFQREAEILASLNHPGIAAIYGLEDSTSTKALVLELVAGLTLTERLAHGPIAFKEVIAIATQIADALDAAHARGIVHRDLKPANVVLRTDGTVKVLDFGLAKAFDMPTSELPPDSQSHAPTRSSPFVTDAGGILGTPAYMSPEQTRGQTIDARTDIWAFGCVLYEMLAGCPAFGRATIADTLTAILDRDPDWSAFPRATPPRIVRTIRRCLEKDPRRRWHAIADVRLELEHDEEPEASAADGASARGRVSRSTYVLAAAISALAVAAVAGVLFEMRAASTGASSSSATRLSLSAPGQVTPQTSVAVSPDGRQLVFVSTESTGKSMLWLRDLDALEPHPIAGTEDAAHPFWAPDGRAIGFLAGGQLKRVDATGGQVLTLADVTTRSGGAWSRRGVILFSPRANEIAWVSDTGGPVTTVLKGAKGGVWPCFLPDDEHFLFFRRGTDHPGVYVGSLHSGDAKFVVASPYKAAFVDPHYLLFIRGDVLLAQPFDVTRLELTGEAATVAQGVWSNQPAAQASFSASPSTVAYINASLENTELAWFDRSGRPAGTLGAPGPYGNETPQIAPDGLHVAVTRGPSGEIWIMQAANAAATRFTLEAAAGQPIWSPNASRVLFEWSTDKGVAVSVKDASGAGASNVVGHIGFGHLWDWSADGKWIVFGQLGPEGGADLWLLDRAGTSTKFAQSRFHKTEAQIAPNGRWLAYTSYESGRDEVYVESFPNPGDRRQISTAGGMQPRWRRDGSELFFLASDQQLMAVPIGRTTEMLSIGPPAPLFKTRIVPQGSQSIWFNTMYDVAPDGQKFLINGPPNDPGPPMTVVLNWSAALKK